MYGLRNLNFGYSDIRPTSEGFHNMRAPTQSFKKAQIENMLH